MFLLPFVPESGEDGVSQQYGETQAPDQGNGVEEICISGSWVDPKVVESRSEKAGVQDCRACEEGITHHCARLVKMIPRFAQGEYSHGKRWRYNGSNAKNSDASEMLGYGLKMAKTPKSAVMMNKGCLRKRVVRPPT